MDKKLPKKRIDRILWLDLEMTGLSPTDDSIFEVAAIVTDWNFKEIATYQGVVKNNNASLKKRLSINSIFWDANPASKDALLKQNSTGKPLQKIEDELLAFVNKNFKAKSLVLLGGNSIHIDRRFLVTKWPRFEARLHYRMLDVSAWKVVFEGKFNKKFTKPDAHRALDDIRGSIMELQYYLSKLR